MPSTDYSMIQQSHEPKAHALDANQHHQLLMNLGDANKGSEYPFPVKLHYMLNDVEKRGFDDIVSWLPSGNGFIIHKPKEVTKHVLPIWFRQRCYGSFQRQLNLYNFTRIKSGSAKGGYCHELFKRGQPDLSYRMRRFPIKKATRPNTEQFLTSYRTEVAASFLNMKTDDANTPAGFLCASKTAYKPFDSSSSTLGSNPQWLQSSPAKMDQRNFVSVEGARGVASSTFAVPDVINSDMMKAPLMNQKSAIALSLSSLLEKTQSRRREDQYQGDAGQQCPTTATPGPLTALQTRFPETTTTTLVGVKETLESTTPQFPSFPSFPSSSSLFRMDSNGLEDNRSLPSLDQQSHGQQQQQRPMSSNGREKVRRSSSFLFLKDLFKEMEGADFASNQNCLPSFHHDHTADAAYGQSSSNQESWTMVCPPAFSEPEIRAQIIRSFLR